MKRKKILIIGHSAKEYALAKKLSEEHDIFVISGSETIKEFATCVDIRENSTNEILKYAVDNSIDMTIPLSEVALKSDIVELFTNNQQQIFAPSKNAVKIAFDKATVKKILYKLRIPTPKFGIFEKSNMVYDYIKNLKHPFVIKTNEHSSATVFTSTNSAKKIIESILAQQTQKIIVEDYIYGTPFAFYTITDGYKALPLGSSILYKHSLDGDGGQLTDGMGACAPNYKLSVENEYFLMDNVIYPTLDYLEIEGNPYVGILGVNGIYTEDGKIQILGYQAGTLDCDTDAILNLIDTNLYTLFESCCIGSFSDEVEYIKLNNVSTVSIVLTNKNTKNQENAIKGLELINDSSSISFYSGIQKNRYLEYEAQDGNVLVISSKGNTIRHAAENAYSDAKTIDFLGKTYRTDICKIKASEL
jgi:phosphoribosylamine--glycine ligase